MKRRLVAGIVAAVLALVSAGLVVTYTATADSRALAGQQPVAVLVVVEQVSAGTPVSELLGKVQIRQLPAVAVVPDAVRSVTELRELIDRQAVTDLHVGEQVLASRFVLAGQAGTSIPVPDGLQEVSLRLPVERVVGGRIIAGSTAGVLVSAKEPDTTTMALTEILVTRVDRVVTDDQAAEADTDTDTEAAGSAPVTDASYVVTVAVSAADAEELIWGAEHGTVWLSLQNESTDHAGRRIVTREKVAP